LLAEKAPLTEEPKVAIRYGAFLKGVLYFDDRRASIECVVRDMSASRARLTLEHPTTVPDNVELLKTNFGYWYLADKSAASEIVRCWSKRTKLDFRRRWFVCF
jgi:hypothetical protein